MSFFNDYFDRIFCINLDRSPDRWQHVQDECQKHGITKLERFRGHDFFDYNNLPWEFKQVMQNANGGCTASHASLMHIIGWLGVKRALVLEDDFHIVHDDFNQRFEEEMKLVPDDWDMVYLGGHYGEKPRGRINEHVIRAGCMLTTSSYAITAKCARFMAPCIFGVGAIDNLIGGWSYINNVYVLQPRLIVQYACMSIIQNRFMDNSACMLDTAHENMV